METAGIPINGHDQPPSSAGTRRHSRSKILELRDTFRIFDKDEDGSITKEELGTVMRNFGQCPSEAELQQLLADIDINGDGMFSFEEFTEIMSNIGALGDPITEEEELRELRDAFQVFDKQGTGYITPSDLRAVLNCVGEALSEAEIDEMINEVDLDGDGRIDFNEFVAAMCEQTSITPYQQPQSTPVSLKDIGERLLIQL